MRVDITRQKYCDWSAIERDVTWPCVRGWRKHPRQCGGRDRVRNEPRRKLGCSFPLFLPSVPGTGVYGLKNIIFSRSLRNVSPEFHMTHGQRRLDGIWIGKILRMMKFDAGRTCWHNRGAEGGRVARFSFGGLSGIPDWCTRISDVAFFSSSFLSFLVWKRGVGNANERIVATCGTGWVTVGWLFSLLVLFVCAVVPFWEHAANFKEFDFVSRYTFVIFYISWSLYLCNRM